MLILLRGERGGKLNKGEEEFRLMRKQRRISYRRKNPPNLSQYQQNFSLRARKKKKKNVPSSAYRDKEKGWKKGLAHM